MCSIMNHKWIDLVLVTVFKWIKHEKEEKKKKTKTENAEKFLKPAKIFA